MKNKIRGFESISEEQKENNSITMLPLRGTATSGGYDFYAPFDLEIKPQEKVFFWTDVKAKMNPNEVLLLDIRSSMGVKHDLMLSNTIPVIDSDYYNNDSNEGNIGISLRNLKSDIMLKGFKTIVLKSGEKIEIPTIKDLKLKNTVFIKKGERICQGLFIEYKESSNCNTDIERVGGIGSTNK